MNRYNYREELQRNSEAIHKFYIEVLASMTQKLIKENRYKKNISEEDILLLQKKIKEKLNKKDRIITNSLFNTYLLKKQSTKTQFEVHAQFQQDHLTTPKAKSHATEQLYQTAVKTEQSKSVVDYQQDYVDDLAEFQSPQPKAQVKIQNTSPKEAQGYALAKEEQRAKSEDDSESDDYTQRIQERIGSAILGTFCSFNIKRKPKQEKIFIELENVFVKNSITSYENYHSKIACELTKIEKDEIKQLNK